MQKLSVDNRQFQNLLTTVEQHLRRQDRATEAERVQINEQLRNEMRRILGGGEHSQVAFVRTYITSCLRRANADQQLATVIANAPTGALLAALFVDGFDLITDPFNRSTQNITHRVKDTLAQRLLDASPTQIESTIENAGDFGYLPIQAQSNIEVNGQMIDTLIDIRAKRRKVEGLLPACGDIVIGTNNRPGEKPDDPWVMCGKYEYQVPTIVGSKEMRNKTVILIARPGDRKYLTGLRLEVAQMPVQSDAELVAVKRKVRDSFGGRYESFDSEFLFRMRQELPLNGGN